tara:strand:+ start:782 stop:1894 length:1113 start_codon:yes stop_codon:yes gene_type:complete
MIYIIIFIILITILVIIYFIQKNKYNKIITNNYNIYKKNITYYKSDNYLIAPILKNLLNNKKLKKINKIKNCDLYIPNTYTFVEDELINLDTKLNNFIFAIDGCDILAGKNNIWKLLENHYNRKTTCKIMPETWILDDSKDIILFKKNYIKNKIYILKKNIQRKNGILLTNNYNKIIKNFSDYIVIQNYIKNTLLINNRKLNIRIYLLIIRKNNKIHSYLYKNGKCIYTNKDYKYSLDMEENITSLNLDTDIYKINPLTLFDLKDFFNKNNIDYDYIFNKIKNNVKFLHNAYKNKIGISNKFKNNTCFQLFGLDYIITKKLNILLLEINKGPNMQFINSDDYNLKYKLLNDIFETVGILKSSSNNLFIKI